MKKLLYLTDLAYPAKGRNYGEEDIFIAEHLRSQFDVVLCHPKYAADFEDDADLIIFRNTGSILGWKSDYQAFVQRVHTKKLLTFNTFTGKADMRGKQYLPELTCAGFPVIPTVDALKDRGALPEAERYFIKPKDGADSIGLRFLTREELAAQHFADGTMLIQPAVDFLYEVSFYFINDRFEYALYAPDPTKRWELVPYPCSEDDLAFARRFIRWNTIGHGIQRVDACRTQDGRLLLVELEDLNPYLSILLTSEATRTAFLQDLTDALWAMTG